jgi:hypothetical protein
MQNILMNSDIKSETSGFAACLVVRERQNQMRSLVRYIVWGLDFAIEPVPGVEFAVQVDSDVDVSDTGFRSVIPGSDVDGDEEPTFSDTGFWVSFNLCRENQRLLSPFGEVREREIVERERHA